MTNNGPNLLVLLPVRGEQFHSFQTPYSKTKVKNFPADGLPFYFCLFPDCIIFTEILETHNNSSVITFKSSEEKELSRLQWNGAPAPRKSPQGTAECNS